MLAAGAVNDFLLAGFDARTSKANELDGRPYLGFDARTETIELPARPGRIQLVAGLDRSE